MKKSDKLVSVLTPSYNRGCMLYDLWQSLENQTSKNFVWMIVDDGSTDNTYDIVEELKKKADIIIQYIKKNNGGKHTALNVGIPIIDTKLTIIVDSDDLLLPNAIERIEYYYEKYKDNSKLSCYTFLRCHSDGKPIVALEEREMIKNYVDFRIKNNRPGDMAEVFLTDKLKEYPFPEFPNEKFLSEDVVWIKMGLESESLYVNESICVCDYLDGGLTKTDKKIKFSSPLGSMMRGKVLLNKACGIKVNIKGAIIYNCYKKNVNCVIPNELKLNSLYEKTLVFLTKWLGNFYYMKWRKEVD